MDVQFAATTVETEHSKYSKQQTFPQLLTTLQTIAGNRLNTEEITKEMGAIFNFNKPERFLYPEEMIPVSMIPQEVMPIIQQAIEQQQGGGGGTPGPAPAPDQLPPGEV
jgi:hypothetical protein